VFDTIIHGGRVVDGAGNPWIWADVGIKDERIAAVGRLNGAQASRVIAGEGLVVCPGFIDMHAHSDLQVLVRPEHEAKILQGVTLEVLGQDGLSYAPVTDETLPILRTQLAGWNDDPPDFDWSWRTVGEYLDRLDSGIALNVAYLVPHGTVRMAVMGMEERAPSQTELAEMVRLVAQSLEDGAFGLSAGLTYAPGMFANDDEIVELCGPLREHGGFYCPHHRSYGVGALEAYGACIDIARRARVPLHLAHAHMPFRVNEGRAGELLSLVDAARAEGLDVTLDTYPYLAGATYLHAFLPPWMNSGGPQETIERLADSGVRERLRLEMEVEGSPGFSGVPIDWQAIVISGVRTPGNEQWVGHSIADAAAAAAREPLDFACRLLVEEELGVACIAHVGTEANLVEIMKHPAHMAGSDGILVGSRPHPRGWGTFARYLGTYVRDTGVLRLEDAIRKMTSLPAQRLGLNDRGLLRVGMKADVVCFDPSSVAEAGTYEDPCRAPVGIPHVFVNGRAIVLDGTLTGDRPGRALRSAAASSGGVQST
jgi:N-acyl-D-amino-acid deacylase